MKKAYYLLLFFAINIITAQNNRSNVDLNVLQNALDGQFEKGYQSNDISNWKIQSDASSLNKDVWYYYVVQTHNNVEIRNAIANINVNNGVGTLNNIEFIKDVVAKANISIPNISTKEAVNKALAYLNIKSNSDLRAIDKSENRVVFNSIDATRSEVSVELVYENTDDDNLKLAWNVNLELKEQPHWWNIRIDAATGDYLSKNDWMTSCSFGESMAIHASHSTHNDFDFFAQDSKDVKNTTSIMVPSYRVLPYYVESPNHGDFELIVNPAHSTASPNGWHNDGAARTDTGGNNVLAYDDSSNPSNNGPTTDQSSTGLVFDYAYGYSSKNTDYCVNF